MVLVISGIWILLCVVSVCEISVFVFVEFVNIIVWICLLGIIVLFILLLCVIIGCIMCLGKLIDNISLIVCKVIKFVCLVGFVIIVLLVMIVVVIWFKKIVNGKFYGLIYKIILCVLKCLFCVNFLVWVV